MTKNLTRRHEQEKRFAPLIANNFIARNKPSRMRSFCEEGTGGLSNHTYVLEKKGYRFINVIPAINNQTPSIPSTYTSLMEDIHEGFGRTFSHLSSIFGVSRQTLYNWLSGDNPKINHQQKIIELSTAANIFVARGFKPTTQNISRILTKGVSFKEFIKSGGAGKEAAEKLIQLESINTISKLKIQKMLSDKPNLKNNISNFIKPDFNEK